MTITIGSSTFDNVLYDADVDVLYLHVGDPSTAVDFDESPEGHALRFDAEGQIKLRRTTRGIPQVSGLAGRSSFETPGLDLAFQGARETDLARW